MAKRGDHVSRYQAYCKNQYGPGRDRQGLPGYYFGPQSERDGLNYIMPTDIVLTKAMDQYTKWLDGQLEK